jgi:hypothetical protein
MAAPLVRIPLRATSALLSRPARVRAWIQDELGAGRGLGGEDAAVVQSDQAAVETLTQLDAAASIGPAAGAGRQLQPAGTEAEGVVVGDGARV